MRWLESLTEDSATLQAYLQTIARFQPLNGAEESALAERARQRDAEALARLVESQLELVVRYACRCTDVGVALLTLVDDGNRALVEAARRFDPARHGRFGPYALWWVRQAVLHRASEQPPPEGPVDGERREGRVAEALQAAVEHAGTDLGGKGLAPQVVRRLNIWWRRAPMSEASAAEESLELGAASPDAPQPDEDLRRVLAADLETSLRDLDPTERRALERRFGLASSALGLPRAGRARTSASRASRVAARAIRKLTARRSLTSALN